MTIPESKGLIDKIIKCKWVAAIILAGTAVIGIAEFLGASQAIITAATTAIKPTSAVISVRQNVNGSATIIYKVFDIPNGKNIDWIQLDLQQTRPEIAIPGNPSKKIDAVLYDVLIPADIFDGSSQNIEVETRLVQESNEAYALAELELRWSKPGTSVSFTVETIFMDAFKKRIAVNIENSSPQLTLTNYLASKGQKR